MVGLKLIRISKKAPKCPNPRPKVCHYLLLSRILQKNEFTVKKNYDRLFQEAELPEIDNMIYHSQFNLGFFDEIVCYRCIKLSIRYCSSECIVNLNKHI